MAIAMLATCGALAGVAGCGGDDETTSTPAQSTTTTEPTATGAAGGSAESTDRIDIADFKYDPEAVTVSTGSEITWTNSDEAAHTATADEGSFDTGDLDRGDAKSVTFAEPGTFTYYCRFHPFMKGTVEVQ